MAKKKKLYCACVCIPDSGWAEWYPDEGAPHWCTALVKVDSFSFFLYMIRGGMAEDGHCSALTFLVKSSPQSLFLIIPSFASSSQKHSAPDKRKDLLYSKKPGVSLCGNIKGCKRSVHYLLLQSDSFVASLELLFAVLIIVSYSSCWLTAWISRRNEEFFVVKTVIYGNPPQGEAFLRVFLRLLNWIKCDVILSPTT